MKANNPTYHFYGKQVALTVKETLDPELQPTAVYQFGVTRDAADVKKIQVTNDDLLEFTFGENHEQFTWMCDAATLHELFPEAQAAKRSDETTLEIPGTLRGSGAQRGIVGDIAVKLLKVFSKKATGSGINAISKKLEDKNLLKGVEENKKFATKAFTDEYLKKGSGVFTIGKDFSFNEFDKSKSAKPYLLFIHGTKSNTKDAFFDLKAAPVWNIMHELYNGNVIAFQHRTLTDSPLQNAVKLAEELPDNATLHIISHSRGGLVGDILCRYEKDADGNFIGFSKENKSLLEAEDNREKDIESIDALNKIFSDKKKKLKVEKFIRVAAPSAGTILASKRLDQVFNTFFNLLGGDINPFADILKQLVKEAVKTKEDVNVLPGIEAMSPTSPFIKVLNDRADEMQVSGSSLAVISGNGKFSFSLNGLAIILLKLFYRQRNDLVVNTDSMYLGTNRSGDIQYFFDEGGEVNHFKYFLNNSTREAIAFALSTDNGKPIPGFKSVPQLDVPATDRGLEHGELFPEPVSGKKPIVILLPGIMGSNLYESDSRYWLNYWKAIFGGLYNLKLDGGKKISADSIIKTSYGRLASRLSMKYDVLVYPFDWRKQLNECAKEFNEKIIELLQHKQPIKIIGHSMGGVLVRDFIINHNDTWQILNNSKDFRILFLGSPLGGSHRILTVLFGEDAIINSLNMLDRVHTKKQLLQMFCKFPGILSLLPLSNDGENDFAKISTWEAMKATAGDSAWPLPDAATELKTFGEYRDNILAKKDKIDYSNMAYIAGKDDATPCGYYRDEIPPRKELVFLYTDEGDQSVTWATGIPEQIEKAGNVYYAPVSHGALANEPDIFDGIEDILEKGATGKLSKVKPLTVSRDSVQKKNIEKPEQFVFDLSERSVGNTILGIKTKKRREASRVPVNVSVSNGDLRYSSYPVLAGHFLNDGILYAERAIDWNLNNMLTARHRLGIYPGEIGTHELVLDPMGTDFKGAIIIGLGEVGNLTAFQLTKTVEQGVSKYLLLLRGRPDEPKKIGISALIIGSGFGGLSIESSVKAVIEGVNNANEKSASLYGNDAKLIQHIEFVELYRYRALACMYALNKVQSDENSIYNIFISNKKIKELPGLKKRIPLEIAEEWWNRITVKYYKPKDGLPSMVFGASTGEAREEEKELFSSTALIDLFIDEISTQNRWTDSSAKTLFELMIPNEFKDRLRRKGNITWVLDKDSAVYPWELLQDNNVNAKPLCISAGMIRQLSVREFRTNIKRVSEDKALVIADPVLGGFVNQLPGAKAEGEMVDDILKQNGCIKNALINKSAGEIVQGIFSDEYTIMHLAGHGTFDPASPRASGMVIGKEKFLTVFDIEQMTVVPELVFVNCCHLGKVNADYEKYFRDRFRLAANIGTQLIQIGVKAVIAAGWAVDDEAALEFARVFYKKMFEGYNFGDAVKEARNKVYEKYHTLNNTWGAYQCYGDPFYKLKRTISTRSNGHLNYIIAEQAEIDLDNLLNHIETGEKTIAQTAEDLKKITAAVKEADIRNTDITEKEALIYVEMCREEDAVKNFRELLRSENATFSFSSMEKYCNTRAKLCIRKFYFENTFNATEAMDEMGSIEKEVITLINAGATAERINILAGLYKRRAVIANTKKNIIEQLKNAAAYYSIAFATGQSSRRIYTAINAVEIKCMLSLFNIDGWKYQPAFIPGFDKDESDSYRMKKIQHELKALSSAKEAEQTLDKLEGEMNSFDGVQTWLTFASALSIQVCRLFLDKKTAGIAKNWDDIVLGYKTIWNKGGSDGKRIAEMRHLQFLTHVLTVLNTADGKLPKKFSRPQPGSLDVGLQVEELKNAFTAALNPATKTRPEKKERMKS